MSEVPQSGTRLRIDADRQFEGQPGDTVLRIQGQSRDGSQVYDSTYVELDSSEAQLVGWLVRSLRQPTPEFLEKVAQEIQATFPSRIGGRDAQQIAQLAWVGLREHAREHLGGEVGPHGIDAQLQHLAERFERTAAKRRQAASFSGGNGQEIETSSPGGATSGRSSNR